MRVPLLRSPPLVLAFGAVALGACSDNPTQPSTQPGLSQVPSAAAVAHDSWLTRASMPYVPRYRFVTASVPNAAGQSLLYVIGGDIFGSHYRMPPVGRVQAYNVATNTWIWRRDLPTALTDQNGAGVIGGKIYVSGGKAGDWHTAPPTAYLYVYNPGTNTWARKRDMPAPGSPGTTGVIKGKLYVVTSTPAGLAFFRYNPATDRWAILPAPPFGRVVGDVPVVGDVLYDRFYVAYFDQPALAAYDPATNQWTAKAAPPPGLVVHGAALGAKLYLTGEQATGCCGTHVTFVYNPGTDTWSERTPPPNGVSYFWVPNKVFLNGHARLEAINFSGYNSQYIP